MDEEKFAAEIDPIFLDDLKVERERLEGLSKMCDMDIFTEYDGKRLITARLEQRRKVCGKRLISARDKRQPRDLVRDPSVH